MTKNIIPFPIKVHSGREALAMPEVHRFIGERVQYRMAKRCDSDGAQWLHRDFMYDEHRYRTKNTGERHGIVAACIFPNGWAYIFKLLAGAMPERHMLDYERGNTNRVGDALRKFGAENCTIIIMYVGPQDRYSDVETAMIRLFKKRGRPLYNMSDQRSGKGGWKHTAKARAKMVGKNRGRKRTAETRAKIGLAHRGKKLSPEHRAKLSEKMRGRKLSSEHRAKISAKLRGRKLSPEHRAKLSGLKHTAETKAKISRSLREREREHANA